MGCEDIVRLSEGWTYKVNMSVSLTAPFGEEGFNGRKTRFDQQMLPDRRGNQGRNAGRVVGVAAGCGCKEACASRDERGILCLRAKADT
jgi:hypothetical protein